MIVMSKLSFHGGCRKVWHTGFAAIFCLIVATSCSTTPDKTEPKKPAHEAKYFPKIKSHNAKLEIVTPNRTFKAGQPVKLVYRLINSGQKPLTIYEWIDDESANVRVLYMPYRKKIKSFVRSEWKEEKPQTEKVRHSSMQLNPGNSVLIEKQIDFVAGLSPEQVGEQGKRYLVVGELNLMSIECRSRPSVITVKP